MYYSPLHKQQLRRSRKLNHLAKVSSTPKDLPSATPIRIPIRSRRFRKTGQCATVAPPATIAQPQAPMEVQQEAPTECPPKAWAIITLGATEAIVVVTITVVEARTIWEVTIEEAFSNQWLVVFKAVFKLPLWEVCRLTAASKIEEAWREVCEEDRWV